MDRGPRMGPHWTHHADEQGALDMVEHVKFHKEQRGYITLLEQLALF